MSRVIRILRDNWRWWVIPCLISILTLAFLLAWARSEVDDIRVPSWRQDLAPVIPTPQRKGGISVVDAR